MGRGPKKHMKRLNAPKHWMLSKLGGIFAPKPSAGPHKSRECLPLSLILRNRLKYALTRKESLMIVMKKSVLVDSKVRTDLNFPAGFMDVIQLKETEDSYRLLYDTKGRFILHKISKEEASYKLARVVNDGTTAKSIPYVVTHDGRTIRYPDPLVKVFDTVKIDLKTGKIVDFLKFETGNTVIIVKGRNTGRIGVMTARDKHPGSFDIVHVKDEAGNTFATRHTNAFVIGKGADAKSALVSLPRGKGIKKTIFEEREAAAAAK